MQADGTDEWTMDQEDTATMSIEIITLPFSDDIQGFDPAPLESLYRRADVLELTPRFFTRHGRPYWTILARVKLRPAPEERARGEQSVRWTEKVAPQDHGLFQGLREWRARIADVRGVPAYVVLTNRQLAEICTARPGTLAALGTIAGVGPSRLKKYGRDVLAIVTGNNRPASNAVGQADTDVACAAGEERDHDGA